MTYTLIMKHGYGGVTSSLWGGSADPFVEGQPAILFPAGYTMQWYFIDRIDHRKRVIRAHRITLRELEKDPDGYDYMLMLWKKERKLLPGVTKQRSQIFQRISQEIEDDEVWFANKQQEVQS